MKRFLSVLLTFLILCGTITAAGAVSVDSANKDAAEQLFISSEKIPDNDPVPTGDGSEGIRYQKTPTIKDPDSVQPDKKKGDLDLALTGEDNDDKPSPAFVEGEAVVNFKGEFNFDGFDKRITIVEQNTLFEGTSIETNTAVVKSDTMTTDEIIKSLEDNEYIESVTPNSLAYPTALTNDTYAPYQWALQNTGQNNGVADYDTNPENLWGKVNSSSKEAVVAVIDTGVDINHEDLKSVLWKNTYSDLEGYGYCGYDFSGSVSSGQPIDDHGHGTHIAGIIAAQANNSLGISGINKANVKIMALRVSKPEKDGGYYEQSAIMNAFDYIMRAKAKGVNIVAVNCSYGGPYLYSEIKQYNELCDTLGKMGIVTVIAAGNETVNTMGNYYWDVDEKTYYYGDGNGPYLVGPAACESEYAITVAATAEDGYLATFSNYGRNVDIAAPGTSILSTVNIDTYQPSIYGSSTLSSTTSYYQDFDDDMSSSEFFGTRYTWKNYYKPAYEATDRFYFGTKGKSFMVATDSNIKGGKCVFSVPYKLTSSTAAYDMTFSIRGATETGNAIVFIVDKPDNDSLDGVQLAAFIPSWDWDTVHLHIDPNYTNDGSNYYEKSTNRELVFYIVPRTNDPGIIFLDSFGISKQNISTSLYGKYDYKPGTSMAAPYVAGAVALVSAAYPSIGAMDKINAIYKSARKDEHLYYTDSTSSFELVAGQKFLDLKNVANYVPTTPTEIAPTGVEVKPKTAEIEIGGTISLSATVSPSNATNKSITWSSSNESIARVSADGVVTGKATGTVDIIARTANNKSAKCTVTVKPNLIPPTGISVQPTLKTIQIGDSVKLTATVSPSNASNKSVTWISSDQKIAEVSSTGVVTGKSVGTAVITAKTVNDIKAYATITVEAGTILPESIKIEPKEAEIGVGKTVNLTATISPLNATEKSIKWSSADDKIAKVSSTGVVTGVGKGTVTITAKTANNKTATATIKVTADTIYPEKISLAPESAIIGISEKKTLVATITPSNATEDSIKWSSSNNAVATVSSKGEVVGKAVGTATIIARTVNGKSASCTVTVKNDPVKIYLNNIRQIKNHLDTKYLFYDSDGKNIKYTIRGSDGLPNSVYLILTDDNTLMFYSIVNIDESLQVHCFFNFDFSYSFDIEPVMLAYNEGELVSETRASINARTYDPDVGTTNIYDAQTGVKITDSSIIDLSVAILNIGLNYDSYILGYEMGFALGDIGFENYDQIGPYNPALYQRGDYDKDGELTIMDATRAQLFAADLVYTPEEDFTAGIDADGDKLLTILDATRIQNVLAELMDIDGRRK